MVLASFINTASFNLVTGGTVAEKVVLDVIPEFILVLVLLAAGLTSRNIRYERENAAKSLDRRHHRDRSTTPVEDFRVHRM